MKKVATSLSALALLMFLTPLISFSQTFVANQTAGCTPMGVVISVTSPSPGSISSYAWTITAPDGSVQTASTSTYVAILSQSGYYDVSLTINGNQTNTINDYIHVFQKPTASFTINDGIGCYPLCVDFTDVSVEGGGTIVEWNWDFGDGGVSNSQNPNYCYDQPGSFTPIFSVEDENGCFASVSMPGLIQVNSNFPNAVFSSSTQLTCNPPVNINFTNTSSGSSALTSEWTFGDGQTQTVNGVGVQGHMFNSTGTFDVCLTVTDDIGCQDEVCHPVTIFQTAQANFNVSLTQACEGQSITFTNTTTPVAPTVQWDFNGDGVVDSNNQNGTYSYPNAGTYSPSLTVTYGTGCTHTVNNLYSINIIDGVSVDFSADQTASCSAPFTVNFTNESVGTGAITYQWFVNNVLVGSSLDLTYTFNSFGVYDIKLISTNSSGCNNQLVMNDYIVVQAPVVDFDNPSSVCTNEVVPIFNVAVTSVDPVAFYFWDFNGDGNTDATGLTPNFMYNAPGQYNITLTIETVSGCTASYTNTQTINVLTQVSTNFTTSTNVTCAGEPVEFCVENQPGNTFSWNFYDGSGWVIMPMNEYCLQHEYADTGYFDLTITVFNGACNISQTIENFIYVSPPVALFDFSVDCENLTSVEFINTSIEADSVVWDFGDGSPLVSSTGTISHEYPASGEYTVTITAYNNDIGCPDNHSAPVVVQAPNAGLSFFPPVGCPPLEVNIENESFNTNWNVQISNGDVVTANWVENLSQWQVQYQHDGITETSVFAGVNTNFWPEIVIDEGGFHDVTVTVINANGCEIQQFYDNAIEVTANPDFASFSTTNIDVCNSVTIAFTPDVAGLTEVQWIFSDGQISTQTNPTHVFNPPFNFNSQLTATLTATDSQGCESTVTQPLGITPPAVPQFVVVNDPSCEGDAVQFINQTNGPVGTTYFWDFGDPSSSDNTSTAQAPSHVYDENGTYEVCLTTNNGAGCQRTFCNPEGVHIVSPEVSFTYTSNINNCLFGVQFQNTTPGTIIQSHWDFGDDQTGFGTNVYHTYPIGVYDVTLRVINQYGCVDSLTVTDILNYGNQVGPFSQVLDSANCAPFDVELSAFNPADSYFSYFWDFNDGSGDPSGATVTEHTYLQPGTYCPSLIMTDPNGCSVLISCVDPIVVDEFVLAYQSTDYLCFGDTLHLFVNNAETYSWDNTSEITAGSLPNEFFLHPFDDATFLLTGTYSDCVRTDTIFIEVKDLPVLTLDIVPNVCFGDAPIPLDMGMPNAPVGSYTVNGSPAMIFDPSWTAGLIYDVTYMYTDTFQCSNSITAPVWIQPLPVITYNDYSPVCEDAGIQVIDTALPAGGVYTWSNDTIVSFDPAVGEGDHVIVYTYTDSLGCINSNTSIFHIDPIPDMAVDFDDVCQDVGLVLINQSTLPFGSITNIQWDFGVAGLQEGLTHAPVFFPAIGNYPISFTAFSNAGCQATLDTTVNVWAVPHVHFTPDEACQFSDQLFVDQSTIAQDSLVTWLWNVEGTTINSPDSLVYAFQNWGMLPVLLTVISNHGCDDTLQSTVNVHPAPVVSISHTEGCLGVETMFYANATVPVGGIADHLWTFGDDHPDEMDYNADNLYDSIGTYYISYTATSTYGCITMVEDSVRVYDIPEVDYSMLQDVMCAGQQISLLDMSTVASPSSVAEWHWFVGNEEISQEQNPVLIWDQPGTYNLTLQVVSDHGCSADSMTIAGFHVYPTPNAGFVAPEQVAIYNPVVEVTNQASDDVVYWTYDFGDGQQSQFDSGTHSYDTWGVYEILQVVENAFGCKDSSIQSVEIKPDMLIYVPNAFTPDGNGNNDTFYPVVSGFEITLYDFAVVDRWGTEVFHSTNPEEQWDGTLGGEIVQDGVYVWRLQIRSNFDAEIKELSGPVTVLK